MHKKKNVMILMESLVFGGAEKQVISLVNNIDTDKFTVTICYFNKKEDLYPQINKNKVKDILCFNRTKKFDFAILKKIKELCDSNKYDILMCISPYPMLYAYIVKIFWRIEFKIFIAIHLTIINPGIWMKLKYIFFRKIINRCDKILFVCKNQMKYWIEKYNINPSISHYIYNGIDINYFNEPILKETKEMIRSKYRIYPKDIVIGNVAALRSEKKHKDIVSAAKTLRAEGYSVKVLIVGDGPCKDDIIKYSRLIGMEDHVIITGFQEDIRPYLSIFDCKIISSDAVETFSIAALEAMAMSKPIILTNIGGASEMVFDGENGFVFPARDIDALVTKIRYIIDNELFDSMGRRSREILEERFTLQNMISEYEKWFVT